MAKNKLEETTNFPLLASEASQRWPSLSNLQFASSIDHRPGAFLNMFADHVKSNAHTVFVEQVCLTPEQVNWFRHRGWHFALLSGSGIEGKKRAICVRVEMAVEGEVFHATTATNFERIKREGLKTCAAANLIDNGHRLEAEHHIHVSKSLEKSQIWATDQNLLAYEKTGFDSSSVILKLDMTDSDIFIYRDPFSETGWILSTDFVSSKLIVKVE